ncbi:MAG: DMT family transporter [Crocinitomicaceae bacterium]|jgi:drug/metabolite transporter (DMT)-like permease|nr:DMT family transporter [Crocinitomicaceae bacterium]
MFGQLRYHLLLHIIIFIWGFTGILGKLIHLESVYIVWWRVLIAAVGLFLYLKATKWNFAVADRKQVYYMLIVGGIVGAHWMTFYYSIQLSTASLGILCLSTTTLHVTWLEPLIMKRRFLWSEFLFGVLIIFALLYVSGDFNQKDLKALFIGLLSAFFAALFSVCNAKLVEKTPSATLTNIEMVSALGVVSVVMLFQGLMDERLFAMTWSDFWWLLFLGLVCTSFAFLVVVDLVKRLGAFTVSLSINMEPVYTILLAIAILNENEQLGTKFYIGASTIVLVVVINAIIKYRMKSKNPNAFLKD